METHMAWVTDPCDLELGGNWTFLNILSDLAYQTQWLSTFYSKLKMFMPSLGFPDSSVGKECTCNAEDSSLIPRSGRSAGEGLGYPLQYSGLENSMDCIVHGVTKSQTRLSDFHFYAFFTKNSNHAFLLLILVEKSSTCISHGAHCMFLLVVLGATSRWRVGASRQVNMEIADS